MITQFGLFSWVTWLIYQGGLLLTEGAERGTLYSLAEEAAVKRGKPLLVVGRPNNRHPCSPDVTLDIDPRILKQCPESGLVGDVRSIPFSYKHFGAALVSHVLEHLPSLEDAQMAWGELWRVTDEVFVAYPRKGNIVAQMMAAHHLWVTPYGQYLLVEERGGGRRRAIIGPDGSVAVVGGG